MSKNGKVLAKAVSSLFYSWGSDPSPECFWVLTDIIAFVNLEYGLNLEDLDSEELDDANTKKLDKILEILNGPQCNRKV